ncbi:YhcH/YjgK/YiaL family protein [Shewanella surugensis]|uniref:YhcH/YjgK/YiaL family protein n=1 Tax=Shewanella surugensis TaxID=212020 RepID=A0ABT0LG90_9GAMM|nr:YhcH/YjgK/YiaL family protein [Shewanella surugensis]MCL1126698.1 YhcH/YjgK/YiaL family protein [Shewanella surugensis]
MIIDTLENHQIYHPLHPRVAIALQHLATTDFSQVEPGSYPIEGKDIFAIVNDYETVSRETESFEVHRAYIDVQFVVSGDEEFGYLPLTHQSPSRPYETEHDYAEFDYHTNADNASFVQLKAGMFALFFPGDMHMPGTGETAKKVRKVVIKVKL